MKQLKKELRKRIIEKRDRLSPEEIQKKSLLVAGNLMHVPEFQQAKTVMSFLSFQSEVRTEPVIRALMEKGVRVAVPVCVPGERKLILSELKDLDEDIEIGFYCLPEPKAEKRRPLDPKEVEVALVPGVVFTREGWRLGYGGGYYDKFLARNPHVFKIALAFELQLQHEVPLESHDVPVDCVVTEERVVRVTREE